MKKLLLFFGLVIFSALLFVRSSNASSYPFTVSISPTNLTATMTGVTDTNQYQLVILKAPFSTIGSANKQNEISIDPTYTVQKATSGTVAWNISGLNPAGTFYIRVFRLSNGTFNWATDGVTGTRLFVGGTAQVITSSTLKFQPITSGSIQVMAVMGSLNPTANKVFGTDLTAFTAKLYISKKPFQNNDNSPEGGQLFTTYHNITDSNGKFVTTTLPTGIGSDGNYAFLIENTLTPNTSYYFKQVIDAPGGIEKIDRGGPFDSANGYMPTGTPSGYYTNLNDNTYHLLAPWPGLTQILSPNQCAQQKASGKTNPNAVCDVGDFLNFAFKTLIGLTAVVLVLRLMYEGYQYMVSDVPFLKASAKSGFMTALVGLLVALSAYVLLNTINPKLVSNSISIDQVTVGIEGDANNATLVSNGQLPAGVQCPKSGGSSAVAQIAQSWTGKVTYALYDGSGNAAGKNPSVTSDGTAHLDCSAYANEVLNCAGYKAGIDYTNSGTTGIFSDPKAQKITPGSVTATSINGVALKPGDLIGWVAGGSETYGHVMIYVGNGQVMDSHGGSGRTTGNAIGTFPTTKYASQLEYIRRIPY